ncbi:MAG: hypothetical protein COA84_04795 [Robiginitomaculum sp.]|nr:MAG: hypothetical protein COA84_04795 [Robiginitomaculum sp.]
MSIRMRLFFPVSISLLTMVMMALSAQSGFAADPVDDAIRACRESTRKVKAQVICLETAMRRLFTRPAAVQTQTRSAAHAQARSNVTSLPAQQADARAVSRSTVMPARPPAMPKGMGAEQVPLSGKRLEYSQKIERKVEPAHVADFAYYGPEKKLIVVLENGQIWKQPSGDRQSVRLRKGDAPDVLIKRGAVSGYRMTFIKANRTIIVRRFK